MVVEIGPSAVGAIAHLLRERASARQAGGLANEPIKGVGVVLELVAVFLLPVRPLGLGVALWVERLGDLADIFGGGEEVDQLEPAT